MVRCHYCSILALTSFALTAVTLLKASPGSWRVDGKHRWLNLKWHDPKSVVKKDDVISDFSKMDSLRFVAFGTSRTWGAALNHPEQEAYIKLLSPTSLNFGLRATLADYPSLCLHSMIGNDIFDVIVVEFPPYNGKEKDFTRLIKRLRARFPHATIIYLPVAMPMNEARYQRKALKDYIVSQGIQSPSDPAFEGTIRNLNDSELESLASSYARDVYYDVVNSAGGYIVEFPSFKGDIKQYIIENAKYYGGDHNAWDTVHPSKVGHQIIAEKVRQKLSEIFAQRPPTTASATGVWSGGQDRCLSWFPNGNITGEVRDVKNMQLVNFEPKQSKWALEVFRIGGSFSVFCSFPHCSIYISYMIKGPVREYPRVLASVNDNEPKLIDPYHSDYHLRQISYVETIDTAGWATLSVKPLPEATLHFRITGVITTPSVLT